MSASRSRATSTTKDAVAKALEEKKAAAAEVEADTPEPDESPTPTEAERIAALEAQLAQAQADLAQATASKTQAADPGDSTPAARQTVGGAKEQQGNDPDADHVLHSVSDGMTLLGRTWYRGEELRVKEGSSDWEAITDRNGWNIFAIAGDPQAQVLRYDEEKFRSGPWPFQQLSQDDLEAIASDGFASLEDAERARKKLARQRSAGVTGGVSMPMQGSRSISP